MVNELDVILKKEQEFLKFVYTQFSTFSHDILIQNLITFNSSSKFQRKTVEINLIVLYKLSRQKTYFQLSWFYLGTCETLIKYKVHRLKRSCPVEFLTRRLVKFDILNILDSSLHHVFLLFHNSSSLPISSTLTFIKLLYLHLFMVSSYTFHSIPLTPSFFSQFSLCSVLHKP